MLRHAFFPAFKGHPTFLFWGTNADLGILHNALIQIANGGAPLVITNLPNVHAVDTSEVTLRVVPQSTGLRRTLSDQLTFDWALDRQTAREFADKLVALSIPALVGHQYLETSAIEDAMVMVSSGEFRDNLAP